MCLNWEDIARQSCVMVPRWRFFCVLYLQRVAFLQHILDLHLMFHTMCASMVDIQSSTAEIRRGKKERKIEEETTGQNIMSASATQGSHKYQDV